MDAQDDNIEDPQDAQESLFIVEGLSEPAEENAAGQPQIFDVMTPAVAPEEDPQAGIELSPLSINLGEANASTPAPEIAETGEGEVSEEELVEQGLPPLYKWGSIAAGFLVLVVGGAVYWKKVHLAPEPVIAVAKRVVPVAAPVEPEPAPAEIVVELPKSNLESETVAVAPEPVVEAPAIGPEAVVVNLIEPVPAPVPVAEPVRPLADPVAAEAEPRIRRGDGILQLKNGNLFPGRVMKVTAQSVVLRVTEGDYVFPIDDVVQVLPSGSKDYEGFPHGFVELANGNRIWGRILDRGEETVTVASGLAKIVLKRGEVVGVKLGLGVGIVP